MMRGLMVVLACAAGLAQAQEVAKVRSGANRTVGSESGPRASADAARSTPGLQTDPLSRSAGAASGGAAAGPASEKGISGKAADCSGYNTLLHGDIPAVRTYQPPPSASAERKKGSWDQPPFVGAVERCGNVYLFQVRSKSKEPWVVAQVTVEGSNGETLHVNAFGFEKMRGNPWPSTSSWRKRRPG